MIRFYLVCLPYWILHHRIPNKHMMTINFDTITNNNYEVIYVIKTVMKYHLKKIDTSFHISMSLKSFSIYIVKFFELYISAVLLPIVL
jgi:hypothetical protein